MSRAAQSQQLQLSGAAAGQQWGGTGAAPASLEDCLNLEHRRMPGIVFDAEEGEVKGQMCMLPNAAAVRHR